MPRRRSDDQEPRKRAPRGAASQLPAAEAVRARRRILVAQKTMEDWTALQTRDWLLAEHEISVSEQTVYEDRKWFMAHAAQEADEIRSVKIAQMLEVSRGLLPIIHGTGKVLLRDESSFEQDEVTGELIDSIRSMVPTTGQRIEVLKQWMHLLGELRRWVGVERIEPAARPDPADMGITQVDKELAELTALLGAQPEHRALGHPG